MAAFGAAGGGCAQIIATDGAVALAFGAREQGQQAGEEAQEAKRGGEDDEGNAKFTRTIGPAGVSEAVAVDLPGPGGAERGGGFPCNEELFGMDAKYQRPGAQVGKSPRMRGRIKEVEDGSAAGKEGGEGKDEEEGSFHGRAPIGRRSGGIVA